jgi:hypothetical protein
MVWNFQRWCCWSNNTKPNILISYRFDHLLNSSFLIGIVENSVSQFLNLSVVPHNCIAYFRFVGPFQIYACEDPLLFFCLLLTAFDTLLHSYSSIT